MMTITRRPSSLCLAVAAAAGLVVVGTAGAYTIEINPASAPGGVGSALSLGEFNTDGDKEGWSTSGTASDGVTGGVYQAVSNNAASGGANAEGRDPQYLSPNNLALDPGLGVGEISVLEFRIEIIPLAGNSLTRIDLFWDTNEGGFHSTRRATIPDTSVLAGANTYRITFDAGDTTWSGASVTSLDRLRLDPIADVHAKGATMKLDTFRYYTVPEPTALLLAAAGLLGLRRRRR